MPEAQRVLVAGEASGLVLALDEPLSFWGGFESETGTIIDRGDPPRDRARRSDHA